MRCHGEGTTGEQVRVEHSTGHAGPPPLNAVRTGTVPPCARTHRASSRGRVRGSWCAFLRPPASTVIRFPLRDADRWPRSGACGSRALRRHHLRRHRPWRRDGGRPTSAAYPGQPVRQNRKHRQVQGAWPMGSPPAQSSAGCPRMVSGATEEAGSSPHSRAVATSPGRPSAAERARLTPAPARS